MIWNLQTNVNNYFDNIYVNKRKTRSTFTIIVRMHDVLTIYTKNIVVNNNNKDEILSQTSMVTNVNAGDMSSLIDSIFEWNHESTRLRLNSGKLLHLIILRKQGEFTEHQSEILIGGLFYMNINANALHSNIILKSGKDIIKTKHGNSECMVDKDTNIEYCTKVAKQEGIQSSCLLLHVSMNDTNAKHDYF